ncbi:NAD(P)/FAD-dependent oxidoreductase [Arthrobacter sp. H35-D1]|uniref:dihydrolipoyl dehydrogenase family protein n=1 Tax=Arthrobacter sp. H35-D1 TaxID=3046202 RepID=UPI0024B8BF47|nr:NAD(P)/FAD-dependent oxidoreductase [Arthrobacter sp. H35-D1]MDJ0311956.1 NAD(P)/FAD-dependent oxidoreductase [Arthrobacter sp. H35-D1]
MAATNEKVDVVVIGMGPGGESLAGELAAEGLSVVGVEARLVGGECPYFGCVPSKMMIRAGNAVAEAQRIPALAGSAQVASDFSVVAERIRSEATDNWDDAVAAKRFTDKGGRLVRGTGRLVGPKKVAVTTNDGDELTFSARRAVVLNPGTDPAVPSIPGLEGTPFWTNREAMQAEKAPKSLIILGGGPVAVELGQAFARFGTKVTLVVRGPRLLSKEEPEASEILGRVFHSEGIKVLYNSTITAVAHANSAFKVEVTRAGGAVKKLSASMLLVAAGRTPALAGLDLPAAGITSGEDAGGGQAAPDAPSVDSHMQLAKGLYLIGDAAGLGPFTHMSMYQANIATGHILGQDRGAAESHAVPRVTFTDPEVGAVGLNEQQAREAGLDIRVGTAQVPSSTRGWIHKAGNEGFIKVVEDSKTGVLVGASSMGPHGGEVLSALALAVHARIPVKTLGTMIYAYPTFHRAIAEAVAALE